MHRLVILRLDPTDVAPRDVPGKCTTIDLPEDLPEIDPIDTFLAWLRDTVVLHAEIQGAARMLFDRYFQPTKCPMPPD